MKKAIALSIKRWVLLLTIGAWQFNAFCADATTNACTLVPSSQTCIDATPCKMGSDGLMICLAGVTAPKGGSNVTQACWQYAYTYACGGTTVNTCTAYEKNPLCGVITSSCQDHAQPSGACDSWNYTYSCQTSPAVQTPQVTCANGLFDTSQFATPANTNNTFANAAVAQEILRESQLYSDKGVAIFAGVSETCRKGYAGIKNCCKTSPGAKNNAVMAGLAMRAAASVVKYYGQQEINIASNYMFDAMYSNGLWTSAMEAMFTTEYAYGQTALLQTSANGFEVGAYGFTYSSTATTGLYGTTGATGTGLFQSDTILLNFGDDGVLMFNPYVFVAMVVIAILTSLSTCSQEEQMLAMHKGANLSVYKKTECSSSWFGACVEHTDTYCSFNSVLAKIVNTQGKAQLGMDPSNCSGFTIAQLGQIDFSKIDFTEFTASVMVNATNNLPTSSQMTKSYTPLMESSGGGSAQTGTQQTTSSIVGAGAAASAPPPNVVLPTYGP